MTGAPLRRAMPLDRAILWRPTAGGAPSAPDDHPIFVEPKVLTALAEHAQATPQQGVLGFLAGDLCHDAQRGVPFLYVDATVRLNQAIYGDKTNVVVSTLWERVHAELETAGGQVLGWYHSHPPQGIALAPGDIETHLLFFTRPWNFALVLGVDAWGPSAAFYRPGHDAHSVTTGLPFYEIAESATNDGKPAKSSALPWTNYLAQETVVYRSPESRDAIRQSAATPAVERATLEVVGRHPPSEPPPAPPAPLPVPPRLSPSRPVPPRPSPSLPVPRPRVATLRDRSRSRWSSVVIGGVITMGLAAGVWLTGFPFPRSGPAAARGPSNDSVLVRLDTLAETLSRAVTSYEERAALYERRGASCDELGRGLVLVEETWIAYNARGKAGATLDAARARRDQALEAAVDSAERHFDRTACARP